MGILSQIEVSWGYQYVMKILASCYFALKYSFSLKLVFVIFPCNTQFTSPPIYLLNHSSKHSHSYNIQAAILVSFLIAFSSPQQWKIYQNLSDLDFFTLSIYNLSQRPGFVQSWGPREFRVNSNSFGWIMSNLILWFHVWL